MKSARIIGPNEPLEVVNSENPKPRDNQVVVKVKAVGVCHSDLHLGKVAMTWEMVNL